MTRLISYLLGGFICWELVFLPLSNFWLLVPREMPPLPSEILSQYQRTGRATPNDTVQAGAEAVGQVSDAWAYGTGQIPGWLLFAPVFPEAGAFLNMRLETADGQIAERRSPFEPEDAARYVRFQPVEHRLFNREILYAIVYAGWKPDSFRTRGPEWKDAINEHVLAFRPSLCRYVQWQIREWKAANPEAAVTRVLIGVRVYGTNPIGADPIRAEPVLVPLARWDADKPDDLTAYDPTTVKYRPITRAVR
jgi:hypothetical protein